MTASTPASPGIFISYRRDDSAVYAGWLFDRLVGHYGRDQIFKDIDSIPLGDDFAAAISTAVASCQVLLALIGGRWLTAGGKAGRRLDNPRDFVRLEIEAALSRGIRVIPILLDGATMPKAGKLPASLAGLSARQALNLSTNRFDSDFGRLLKVLDKTFNSLQSARPRTATPGQPISAPSGNSERLRRLAELRALFPSDTPSAGAPATGTPSTGGASAFQVQERCIYVHPHGDLAFFMAWPQLRVYTGVSLPPGAWPITVPLSSLTIPGSPELVGIWNPPFFNLGSWTQLTDNKGALAGRLAVSVEGVGTVYARWA
jgi:TIR domain